MKLKKILSAALLVAALSAGAALIPSAASADAFGSCPEYSGGNTGCRADDAKMDYCTAYPWPAAWGNQFGPAIITLNAQTDMYEEYAAHCQLHTDIGGYLSSSPEFPSGLGSTTRGVTICTKKVSLQVCDQGSLVLNTGLLQDTAQRRKTLCHEIGHFAGLTHGSTYGGCMVSGTSTNNTYAAHHVAHINAAY